MQHAVWPFNSTTEVASDKAPAVEVPGAAPGADVEDKEEKGPKVCKFTGYKSTDYEPTWVYSEEQPLQPRIKWKGYNKCADFQSL